MNGIQSITLKDDVTLISLQDSPADIALVSRIFQMISDAGIDVDMISQTPPHGSANPIRSNTDWRDTLARRILRQVA